MYLEGGTMDSRPFTTSTNGSSSTNSSGQSIIDIGTVRTGDYDYNVMSGYSGFSNVAPLHNQSRGEDLDQDGVGEDVTEDDEKEFSRGSRDSSRDDGEGVAKRKPRVTLARGGACVICRTRKLKCSGDRPCKSCEKAGHECRYEELQRRKPKAVLLDERLADLERLLGLAPGEPIENIGKRGVLAPSPLLTPPTYDPAKPRASPLATTPLLTSLESSGASSVNLGSSFLDVMPPTPQVNSGQWDVPQNSALELALISLVLPYTPYLLIPVHPERFIALLSLPPHNPSRPHPALLYILFTEAVLILERGTPLPRTPRLPYSLFPHNQTPRTPNPPTDTHVLRQHMQGRSTALFERARSELENGIRNVDRPFDLVRAAIGIARHLYSLGRFIEGWNIPVSRLIVSCGLHRQTGNFVSPDGFVATSPGSTNPLPQPYAPAHFYPQAAQSMTSPDGAQYPILRMRPVILPPARDQIEVAERSATFWAAKMQDWAAGIGWGWSIAMSEDECTTEWPWGTGVPEPRPSHTRSDNRSSIRALHDPILMAQQPHVSETTYTLAVKSVALLHRASHLFDLPDSVYPIHHPDGRVTSAHIPPKSTIEALEQSLRIFRQSIPQIFADRAHDLPNGPDSISPRDTSHIEPYDAYNDPWFILLHANLYTAEMMMWKEMAHHQVGAYERAVGCARAMVVFIARMRPEHWVHVDMTVVLDLSLCSRFLFKESDRLRAHNELRGAAVAAEEAESLRQALKGEYSRWMPMASLHGLIVQRVREGWSEKEGEYERM